MTDPRSRTSQTVKWKWRPARRIARIVLLAALFILSGIGCGMGLRKVLSPLLPAWLVGAEGDKGGQTSGAQATESGRKIAFWKSTMIPNYISPKPGLDPMGMKLVPVYEDELGQEKFISLTPEQMRNIGLRVTTVQTTSARRAVRSVGRVDYAEPLLADVTLKVGGWIENLNVNFVGQKVEKGEPLFSLYSPELVTAEEEYLLQLRNSSSAPTAQENKPFDAYDKLRYWDVPEEEIKAIEQAGVARKSITFRSPVDGWVIEKHAIQGMYMKPGSLFYRIADLSKVWVYVYVYSYQLTWLRVGQSAELALPYQPGHEFQGKVIYIYPQVDAQTRQIRVRLEFENPQLQLKPEMYGNVRIADDLGPCLATPMDAVIYTGARKSWHGSSHRAGVAYVQAALGTFEPRDVILGDDLEQGQVEILSGLEEGQQVVVTGQFLLDTEHKVKQNILAMFRRSEKAPASSRTPLDQPDDSSPTSTPGREHN